MDIKRLQELAGIDTSKTKLDESFPGWSKTKFVNEGELGQMAGAALGKVAGTALGGPVGGAVGGAVGSKMGDELTGESIGGDEVDFEMERGNMGMEEDTDMDEDMLISREYDMTDDSEPVDVGYGEEEPEDFESEIAHIQSLAGIRGVEEANEEEGPDLKVDIDDIKAPVGRKEVDDFGDEFEQPVSQDAPVSAFDFGDEDGEFDPEAEVELPSVGYRDVEKSTKTIPSWKEMLARHAEMDDEEDEFDDIDVSGPIVTPKSEPRRSVLDDPAFDRDPEPEEEPFESFDDNGYQTSESEDDMYMRATDGWEGGDAFATGQADTAVRKVGPSGAGFKDNPLRTTMRTESAELADILRLAGVESKAIVAESANVEKQKLVESAAPKQMSELEKIHNQLNESFAKFCEDYAKDMTDCVISEKTIGIVANPNKSKVGETGPDVEVEEGIPAKRIRKKADEFDADRAKRQAEREKKMKEPTTPVFKPVKK